MAVGTLSGERNSASDADRASRAGNPKSPRNRPPAINVGPALGTSTNAKGAGAEPDSDDDDNRLDGPGEPSAKVLNAAPPWLISLVVHMVALIALGLIIVPLPSRPSVKILAIFANDKGEQLDDESLDLSAQTKIEVREQVLTPKELPPVNDPFAAPAHLDISLYGTKATSRIDAPQIGLALTGREKGMKQALLAAYGGNATTEAAVLRGLLWLKRNQRRDGSWSLSGPYSDGSRDENVLAATAMALLAFQGHGDTHLDGQFVEQVKRGWDWMLKQQDQDGNFWKRGPATHRLYSQAQATIAICELYGMTRDSSLRKPAQQAVNYAVKIQSDRGGWRYQPGAESDTSVTGWFVMALQSAMMAGLEVPSATLDRISAYLDSVSTENGSLYRYRPGRGPTPVMTAEALLCRQYLGWTRDDPRLLAGVEYISANPIDWSDQNVYYWYYATQVAHHMEGETWERWNDVLRQSVPAHQENSGKEEGSWSPVRDRWFSFGGRLYTTCLSIYMLEVYYRHLPIYSRLYNTEF